MSGTLPLEEPVTAKHQVPGAVIVLGRNIAATQVVVRVDDWRPRGIFSMI